MRSSKVLNAPITFLYFCLTHLRNESSECVSKDYCDTCLSFVPPASGVWTLVDDELFLPEHWFSPEYAALRQAVGVPAP